MAPRQGKKLYFVALVVPEPYQSEITQMKQTAKVMFDAGHALKSPAHITLIPPFWADEEEIENLAARLSRHPVSQLEKPVELDGFDRFDKRVIFVDVRPHPRLQAYQQALFDEFRACFPSYGKPNRFHPHVTVAFKDLRREVFDDAWNLFKDDPYRAEFMPRHLTILRHDKGKWHIWREI
ncbi:MAG: 2'-5' RNA ligase family protein [Chlorobi bacterium]|nr:2'-5' RNA ligase family protein [Chlorobiota bacterium]